MSEGGRNDATDVNSVVFRGENANTKTHEKQQK